jgi:hypothetical protein
LIVIFIPFETYFLLAGNEKLFRNNNKINYIEIIDSDNYNLHNYRGKTTVVTLDEPEKISEDFKLLSILKNIHQLI